jgi:hypothetical protein
MTMIKPFEIMSTRPEPEGTGVFFRVSKRFVFDRMETVKTLEGYLLVPRGKDIDQETFDHLKIAGWIQ